MIACSGALFSHERGLLVELNLTMNMLLVEEKTEHLNRSSLGIV